MSYTGPIPFESKKNPVKRICLIIGLVAAIMVGSMGFIFYLGEEMVTSHMPQIDAVMEIKLQATMGHLWLEEIVSGDRKENAEDVLKYIDKADWYAKAMLEGGQSKEGRFIPLKDQSLRREIEQVRKRLGEFREITLQRLQTNGNAGIGSTIDQQYDEMFRAFVLQADRVEAQLQQLVGNESMISRVIQLFIIAVCLGIMLVVGTTFARFTHRHIKSEQALQAANQQLSANEQQLRAANQQLRAQEQQLRASNHQLISSEQQLRAANQQLQAQEQQLRASNQQLTSSEQQLIAANQQLTANEQELRREKDRVQRYLDVAGVILVAIDRNQRVDMINRKGCEILGYDEAEVLGKNWFEYFIPERLRAQVGTTFERIISGEIEALEHYENPILTREGEERLISWYNTILRDDEGRIICSLSSGEDITERNKRERELDDYRNKLRSLVSELTIAEDRERKNIASLLHDDLLQKLALSKMKLSMLRETLESNEQLNDLDNIHGYVSDMFEDVRSLTLDLCPPILYDIGLEAAVRDWLQKEVAEKHGIEVDLEIQGQPLDLDEDLRIAIYRAIREMLMNVIKHAKAKNVTVKLINQDHIVKVEVKDDGIGFEQTREEPSSGLGLFTIRERMEYFGGSLKTESTPGKGTRVILSAVLTD